jgi:hypothetical protein
MAGNVCGEDAKLTEQIWKNSKNSSMIGTADLHDVHCRNAKSQPEANP